MTYAVVDHSAEPDALQCAVEALMGADADACRRAVWSLRRSLVAGHVTADDPIGSRIIAWVLATADANERPPGMLYAGALLSGFTTISEATFLRIATILTPLVRWDQMLPLALHRSATSAVRVTIIDAVSFDAAGLISALARERALWRDDPVVRRALIGRLAGAPYGSIVSRLSDMLPSLEGEDFRAAFVALAARNPEKAGALIARAHATRLASVRPEDLAPLLSASDTATRVAGLRTLGRLPSAATDTDPAWRRPARRTRVR